MWFAPGNATVWMPSQESTVASFVDNLYYFIYYTSVVAFLAVVVVGAVLVAKYKFDGSRGHKPEPSSDHSTLVEIAWTMPVVIVLTICFFYGAIGFLELRNPPDDAYEVNVTAYKWAWLFKYPNGGQSGELHVPPNKPVRLIMTSDDVLHSFYAPNMRVKQDVVPGRYTDLWFEAMRPGTFDIFCTEYCGTKHSEMLSKLTVHKDRAEFDKWLEELVKIEVTPETGKDLLTKRGCIACHSLDGTKIIGPTFKGAYGKERPLADGSTVKFDENYVRESIVNPQAKIAQGFQPVMPTFQGKLSDDEISAIILYLKTLQ